MPENFTDEEWLKILSASARKLEEAKSRSKATPEEIKSLSAKSGKASPADFIAPYYGNKFATELRKARRENMSSRMLQQDSFKRLFEDIPFDAEPDSSNRYEEEVDSGKVRVVLGDEGSRSIRKENAGTYAKMLKSGDPEKVADAEKAIFGNAYGSAQELEDIADQSAAEHEFGHHFAQPDGVREATKMTVGEGGLKMRKTHLLQPEELVNAIGRVQRETFAATGKRYEKPEDFEKVVLGGEMPNYLSTEGKRLFNHLRQQLSSDKRMGTEYLKKVSKVVPSLVSTDTGFDESVEARIKLA